MGNISALILFIGDAINFVETFKDPIAENAAHIYISALPFAPSHSFVSQHYLPQYPHTLAVKGGPQAWSDKYKRVSVTRACLSLDGTRIAAVFAGGTLCIYDTTTGQAILPPLRADCPRSVIFSQDGKLVATGGYTLQLWNAETGEEVESFDIDACSLAFSPDGTCIAAACGWRSKDHYVRVFNLELAMTNSHHYIWPDRQGIRRLNGEVSVSPFVGHEMEVHSVAYSPDGKQIASCSEDRTVQVWDVSTGSATFNLRTDFWNYSVAFSPDGTQILAFSIELINVSTGSGTRLADELTLSSVFSADGRFIASATYTSTTCKIWDVSTHQTIVQLVGHRDSVYSVAFFPDGKQIMSASEDGTIRVWDVDLLEERGEMDGWQVNRPNMSRNWNFGPEGEYLFWTPYPFRHARNTLVIGGCAKIDVSNFVHGDEWVKCREPLVEQGKGWWLFS
jgi:WD40 repeat protein